MHVLLLLLAASPVTLDCALETDVEDPRRVFIRAPAAWAVKGDLTAEAKKKVTGFLYEAARVKSFRCRPLKGEVEHLDGYLWLEVKADGTLEDRGPRFGPPLIKRSPVLTGAPLGPAPAPAPPRWLSRGPPLSDTNGLVDWLEKKSGPVMLPVRLKRGQVGFTGRGAKVGALELQCDDSRLGISLDARARQLCGAEASACALWLLGEWSGKDKTFTVNRVEEKVTGDEPADMSAYAWSPGE